MINVDNLHRFAPDTDELGIEVGDYPVNRDGGFAILAVGDTEKESLKYNLWLGGDQISFEDFQDVFLKTFSAILQNMDVDLGFYADSMDRTAWRFISVFDKFYRCIVHDCYHEGRHSDFGPYCGLLRINVEYEDKYLALNYDRVKNVMKGLENVSKGLVKEREMYHPAVQMMQEIVEEDLKLAFPFTAALVNYKVGPESYNRVQPTFNVDMCMDGQVGLYRYACAYAYLMQEGFGRLPKKPCTCSKEAVDIVEQKGRRIFDVLKMSSELLKDEHYEGMKKWWESNYEGNV